MSLTSRLCRELEKFLGVELVKCRADTIDYMRLDTHRLMKEMGKERWKPYYEGSIWVNESAGTIGAGDVVVPIELTDEMVRRLTSFGCKPAYIHKHEEFKTSHIHLEDCLIKSRESRFAELVSE